MVAFLLLALGALAPAQTPAETRPWTLLVYGGADNNADGPLQRFLDSVRKALDDDPGLELVVFVDRSPGFSHEAELFGEDFAGARLYRLRRDAAERLDGGPELSLVTLDGDAELDFADARTLARFVEWGKRRFPARRTGLLIYSHADGRSMCPDETSERSMGIAELSDALGARSSLDFLALELCNMGGIEIAYQWRPGTPDAPRFGADVLVAIPNAGPPLDWDRAFERIRSPGHAGRAGAATLDPAAMTAADFGRLVVEEGRRGRELAAERRDGMRHEAAACYDLRAAQDAKRAVDALARALAASGAREAFKSLRDPAMPAEHAPMNYTDGGPYVDLFDLARRLAGDEAFPPPVRAAAEAVQVAVDRLVVASFGMSSYAGFEPGRNGVFIVLPASEPGILREFGWYTPLEPAAPAGGRGERDYGRWAFLADGGTPGDGVVQTWFELLDLWYDDADERGGSNGYRP